MPQSAECANCHFSIEIASTLECHRWPPLSAGLVEGAEMEPLTGIWPRVQGEWWCGEYKPKRQDYNRPGLRHYTSRD